MEIKDAGECTCGCIRRPEPGQTSTRTAEETRERQEK